MLPSGVTESCDYDDVVAWEVTKNARVSALILQQVAGTSDYASAPDKTASSPDTDLRVSSVNETGPGFTRLSCNFVGGQVQLKVNCTPPLFGST